MLDNLDRDTKKQADKVDYSNPDKAEVLRQELTQFASLTGMSPQVINQLVEQLRQKEKAENGS